MGMLNSVYITFPHLLLLFQSIRRYFYTLHAYSINKMDSLLGFRHNAPLCCLESMGSESLIFPELPVSRGFSVPSPRQRRCPAPTSPLYPLPETLSAQHPGLVDRIPNLLELVFGNRLGEQGSVGIPSSRLRLSQRQIAGMGRYQLDGLSQGVSPVARPGVFPRLCHHPGTDRVELDVAADGQKIVLAIHQAGLEAPLP